MKFRNVGKISSKSNVWLSLFHELGNITLIVKSGMRLWFVMLLGMATTAASAEDKYERIVTEEDFVKHVVGKTLIYDSGAVIIFLADRNFSGGFSGSTVWGEWVWREDRICHQINIGEKRYKVTCKVPQILKNRIRFIREDGSSYGVAKIR